MGKHALLSASSSKRWLSCTPSARLEEQFRDEAGGSVFAEERHTIVSIPLKAICYCKDLRSGEIRPLYEY